MPIRFIDIVCSNAACMFSVVDQNVPYGDVFPLCERCGAPTVRLWTAQGTAGVSGDECDVTIKHGLCHEDGSPRRFTSKAELAKAAKDKGLVNYVRHAPPPGTDKSKFTSRWY